MTDQLVTQSDVTQALSRLLMDAATGKPLKKSTVEKQIDISDALCRRMQARINYMKVYIDAKKHGVDFTAAMKEIRQMDMDTAMDIAELISQPDGTPIGAAE